MIACPSPAVRCPLFDAGRCRSCTDIRTPYPKQLADKQARVEAQLGRLAGLEWLPPAASAPAGFRNRAKMAVGGSVDAPTLGIAERGGRQVDLVDCLLYPPSLQLAFEPLKRFISRARLIPYAIDTRRGELKFVLLTVAEHSGELMLRLVLRSREALARIRRELPSLRAELPMLRSASVNLQPLPAAVFEGPKEIPLDDGEPLPIELDGIRLYLHPQGFFQTNTRVAAALYRQAADWVDAAAPTSVWDLYCGIGGFALHCADGHRQVTGIERSPAAVAGATRAARERGLERTRFLARDVDAAIAQLGAAPELVVVNPPRRGIGTGLCAWLEAAPTRWLLYSSCNPDSLAADLARMPSLRPRRARLFDMFPHTAHCEVLVLADRTGPGH